MPKVPRIFAAFLWRSYLVERRYDILGDVVDPGISVIGTGAHEISRNLQEFSVSMERESAEWNGVFTIKGTSGTRPPAWPTTFTL